MPVPSVVLKHVPQGRETVLLVEDEAALRRYLRDLLEGAGYVVLDAADAVEALEIGRRRTLPVDLLLTDIVMPGLSGGDLAERFRKAHPETTVLFMSGYAEDAIIRRVVAARGAVFLQKPFTPNGLLTRVREMLDARAVSGDVI